MYSRYHQGYVTGEWCNSGILLHHAL